jgi:hypothetical protein
MLGKEFKIGLFLKDSVIARNSRLRPHNPPLNLLPEIREEGCNDVLQPLSLMLGKEFLRSDDVGAKLGYF